MGDTYIDGYMSALDRIREGMEERGLTPIEAIQFAVSIQKKEMRNSQLLKDFTAYCEQHPSERFWQALRNWSGFHIIISTQG